MHSLAAVLHKCASGCSQSDQATFTSDRECEFIPSRHRHGHSNKDKDSCASWSYRLVSLMTFCGTPRQLRRSSGILTAMHQVEIPLRVRTTTAFGKRTDLQKAYYSFLWPERCAFEGRSQSPWVIVPSVTQEDHGYVEGNTHHEEAFRISNPTMM